MPGTGGKDYTPLTPAEEKEISTLCANNPFFKLTKQIVEEELRPVSEGFVFRLDNADYKYRLKDLSVLSPKSIGGGPMEFEITQFHSLKKVMARPIVKGIEDRRSKLGEDIMAWMRARKETRNSFKITDELKAKHMCIVRWPKCWADVYNLLPSEDEKGLKGQWWVKNLEKINTRLNIFMEDYEKYSGKCFRAYCVGPYQINERGKVLVYEMFLVDLGISTLIPCGNVFKMPHRFMITELFSVTLSVKLERINQFSLDLNDKWKYLIMPGMTLKAQVLWQFDEILIVKLITPSEEQFDKHFSSPIVEMAISKFETTVQQQQRHRKVKKMSVLKGSYPKNMEMVQAEEKEKKEWKEKKSEYIGIGRVHPGAVFELRYPDPIPVEYRSSEDSNTANNNATK